MNRESSVWWRRLLHLLVAHRILVYLCCVVAVGLPLLIGRLGVDVPNAARTAIVAVALGVMVLTYAGELLVGDDDGDTRTDDTRKRDPNTEYPTKTKVAVAVAVVGLAVGAYLALTGNVGGALIFLAGSYLFARLGFRESELANDREREVNSGRGN